MNSGTNNLSPGAAGISPSVKAEIWYTKDPLDFFRINQGQQPHPELYTKQHELEIPTGVFGHDMLEHVFKTMNLEKTEGLRSMSVGDVVVLCIDAKQLLEQLGLEPAGIVRVAYLCRPVGWQLVTWDESLV
jgi:hypothetical protein